MDVLLVFPLTLTFLSTGQSYAEAPEQLNNSCHALCPPGYHKVGKCDDPVTKHRCGKCADSTYTEIENYREKCLRCDSCGHYEVERIPCSFNSNVVCDCKDGYYKSDESTCRPCVCKPCNEYDVNKMKCQHCQRSECLKHPECKRKCTATTVPPAATFPTGRATASKSTLNPAVNPLPYYSVSQMPWLFLVYAVVTFLVIFWLLFFIRNALSCLCLSANKDLEPPEEDPKFNEQCSHQGSSPTTLTFTVSEETPMMSLGPATPERPTPAHISPLLPDAEAARQDGKSEHWPAIVLYAIIKEVPLRRWKEFLRLLSVADHQLERVELEAGLGLGSIERQYQMLRLWSRGSSASLNDVFSALHYMDLSGCAQLLQESLEKLQ